MTATVLSGLFAALGLGFALLALISSRKCAATLQQAQELVSSVRSSRSKIEAHDAELDRVTDALNTLRGKFYAERRKYQAGADTETSPSEPAPVGSLKDELRRKVGLVAGRPAPHQ
jgi:hypothetical protein